MSVMSLLPYWTLHVYYVVNWSYGCVSVSSFWETMSNVSWLMLLLLGPTCKVGQGKSWQPGLGWEGEGGKGRMERSHAYRRLLFWKTVSLGR